MKRPRDPNHSRETDGSRGSGFHQVYRQSQGSVHAAAYEVCKCAAGLRQGRTITGLSATHAGPETDRAFEALGRAGNDAPSRPAQM
jgi:hypothetical protein